MSLLLSPFELKGLSLKNRVVMSPMCMHSAAEDGFVTDWHHVHYGARALGQVALIFPETLAVLEDGRIGPGDLGIWSDAHVSGLKRLVDGLHAFGAKVGAQIGHAGRSSALPGVELIAPSAIPFLDDGPVPRAMTKGDISEMVASFGRAAQRVSDAGFDVLEIHGAHGYLLSEFLSPLANTRTDEYGNGAEGRYRVLREIIDEVKKVWGDRPLFVRVSTNDYADGGNVPESFIPYATWMKEQGVDLVDCSSGGIKMVRVKSYPGYQVPAAELIRKTVGIATSALGMIKSAQHAEEILQNGSADLVFVGRQLLREPFWVRGAADALEEHIPTPVQYTRYGSVWLDTAADA